MYQPSKELTTTETQHPCLPRWRDRIDQAEKLGRFRRRDQFLAGNWDMCAVGELRATIGPNAVPYYRGGKILWMERKYGPRDSALFELGQQFYWAICDNNFSRARDVLDRIEDWLEPL